ncbi:MAG: phenylacetate-CoA oxygenase subunit PaaC [Bacteroidetes bacterium]|jgi:ring-1,2-phenylacetyl-CoA epoxidase subunit PaaC|nr:phenylacetate-CoA oxygenase subunit PaaC [Bacteroidota bacterium]
MSNKVIALKELLYKMADDQLIIGHRNAEWIGIGPVLEEDIAFGSLAQDKTGQSWNLYQLLEKMGGANADKAAFGRAEKEYKCCHLVELPIGEDYAFSLARHFYFDHAEYLRMDALKSCAYPDLAGLAKKFHSEIKYHVFHANTWVKNLCHGTEESKSRMVSALAYAFPYALGIFEPGPHEDLLVAENLFIGEHALREKWIGQIADILSPLGISLNMGSLPILGGRYGYHSEHLAPLLQEMTAVIRLEDDSMEW